MCVKNIQKIKMKLLAGILLIALALNGVATLPGELEQKKKKLRELIRIFQKPKTGLSCFNQTRNGMSLIYILSIYVSFSKPFELRAELIKSFGSRKQMKYTFC